ncbi:MAG TPA: CAP domain-containing protein [Anaerolineales bacterium]|nr:CAP domain-containing protein [Anaerolineales bacterium]
MIRLSSVLMLAILLLAASMSLFPVEAEARSSDSVLPQTGSELLAAVNSLRAAHGLPAYSANSILMQIAQNQADYLAATGGAYGHIGPGGSHPVDRAAAAGYPVSSFFSENWESGSGLSPSGAVSAWEGDAPHLNTMLSASLIEAGAGVSKSGGVVYYVLDAGAPAGSSTNGSTTVNGTTVPVTIQPSQYIVPVTTSTPRSDGFVYHEVAYGQTLWSIAIAYGTTIKQIEELNGLTSIDIYLGQKLLILKGPTPAPVTPTLSVTSTPESVTSTPTSVAEVISTVTEVATDTPVPTAKPSTQGGRSLNLTAILIIGAALLFAALGTWLGTRKPV